LGSRSSRSALANDIAAVKGGRLSMTWSSTARYPRSLPQSLPLPCDTCWPVHAWRG
jgi:hypothetical protein